MNIKEFKDMSQLNKKRLTPKTMAEMWGEVDKHYQFDLSILKTASEKILKYFELNTKKTYTFMEIVNSTNLIPSVIFDTLIFLENKECLHDLVKDHKNHKYDEFILDVDVKDIKNILRVMF